MKRLQFFCSHPAIGIYLCSLAVRILYVVVATRGYYPEHDALQYQSIALNMLHDHCYCLLPHAPTLSRAPLWPIVIAIIYGLFGQHNHIVQLFLCAVGSGTCVVIYLFTRDVFGIRIGILSGVLAALYPFLYIYDGWLYSESLYIFLLFAFCYMLYRLQRFPSTRLMCVGGLLLGAISLTRPNGLLIFGTLLLWALFLGCMHVLSWRILVKSMLIISLVSLLMVLPWTVRNYVVAHRFVPVAVGDGTVLLGAYNDKVVGTWYENGFYQGTWLAPREALPEVAKRFPDTCSGTCEVVQDDTYRYYALQWIEGHPGNIPLLLGQHFIDLWQVTSREANLPINMYPERSTSHLVVDMMMFITPIIFILAACGLWVTRKNWRDLLFIYLIILCTVTQSVLLYGISRFRAPLEPMLILLGAGAVGWLVQWVRSYHGFVSQVKQEA